MTHFRKLIKLYVPCLAGLVFLLTLATPRASADPITFDLTVPNDKISGYSGPYATVTVTLNSSASATITVTAYPGFVMGAHDTVGLNISGTASVDVQLPPGQLSGFGSPLPMAYGSGNVDGFGQFNYTLTDFDGYGHGVTTVTFALTATHGTTWADASDILTPNEGGSEVVAHIFVCSATPCVPPSKGYENEEMGGGAGYARATGFAANGEQVPEPVSIALFGSGLIGLAGLVRRRRK
jgi:hypothetical protein